MIIDMHVHSEKSSDSSATVDQYCGIIQKYRRYRPFDGIVLTEHRLYDASGFYQEIGEKYGILIFQGIEVDADLGHLLLYGVTDRFLKRMDISRRGLDSERVIKTINDCGGIAIPAHPFRESSYGTALLNHEKALDEIEVIEEWNGVNSSDQNEKARELIGKNGLKGTGGSDAHYANHHWFLNGATEFKNPIRTMKDLVNELRHGDFRAVSLDSSVLGEF